MQNAIVRINELQNEIKEQSKSVEGAQQYIEQQLKLFRQDEALRNQVKSIREEGQKIANDFFKNHSSAIEDVKKNMASMQGQLFQIDESTKKMIDDTVKTYQAIEGYPTEASKELQEEVERIQKQFNIKVDTSKESDTSE